MIDKKNEAADIIAGLFNKSSGSGDITAQQWAIIASKISTFRTIQEKNSVVARVVSRVANYIGYITFKSPTRLIIDGQSCCGKRTVFIINHKVYDPICCISGISLCAYFNILAASNSQISVDVKETDCWHMDGSIYIFNREQWELLTRTSSSSTFAEIFAANPAWKYGSMDYVCTFCGTMIKCYNKPKTRMCCPVCQSNRLHRTHM